MHFFRLLIFISISLQLSTSYTQITNSERLEMELEMQKIWNNDSYRNNFSNTTIETQENKSDSNETIIPLTIIHVRDSNWSKREIQQNKKDIKLRIERTKEIFSYYCDIVFSPVIIATVDHKKSRSVINSMKRSVISYINIVPLINKGVATKPVIFMIESDLAEKTNKAGAGIAWRKNQQRKPLRNTAILFKNKIKQKHSSGELNTNNRYEVMAHELAHILFNQKHNKIKGNILSNKIEYRSNKISKNQCKQARIFAKELANNRKEKFGF